MWNGIEDLRSFELECLGSGNANHVTCGELRQTLFQSNGERRVSRFTTKSRLLTSHPKQAMPPFKDEHVLVIAPGSQTCLAQLGLPESLTPAKLVTFIKSLQNHKG